MKISIITSTYNSAATLADTLKCISQQDYPDIEHLIIDGGSKDGTLALVDQFPHISKVISEKDKGIYDAMNKGIALANGDVIGILNSDDFYVSPRVLSKVAAAFQDPEVMAVYADLQFVERNSTDKVVRTWRSGDYTRKSFFYGWMPPHPTFFVRKSVYQKHGVFNCDLGSAADYELMLRFLLKHGIKAVHIKEIIIKMRMGGESTVSLKNRLKANKKDHLAWKINGLQPNLLTLYLKPVRKIGQFFKTST